LAEIMYYEGTITLIRNWKNLAIRIFHWSYNKNFPACWIEKSLKMFISSRTFWAQQILKHCMIVP